MLTSTVLTSTVLTSTVLTSTVVLSGYHSGPRWLMALPVCPAEMFGVFDAGIG